MISKFKLIGAASALVLGLMTQSALADVVKIGVLAPVTGKAAADGEDMVRGVKLAIEDLNKAGGINGDTFEVVVGDIGDASADAVATAAERLLGDQAMGAIMTGYASSTNFEIEMMAEQQMVYMIAGNSAQTEGIVRPKPEDFGTVWSLTPSYDGYNTEIVPVIDKLVADGQLKLANKKVAMIASDNPYSKGIAEGMTKAFEAAGWQITQNDLVPFGEINDWRAFLARVRQDNPALVINTDYQPGNAAKFLTQFLEQPTKSLVFIQYAPSVPEFLSLTKEGATGVVYNLLGGVLNTPKNPRAAEVVGKYKEKYGNEPGTYGPALYEEIYIYAEALKKVGDPTKRLEIGKAIGETQKQVASGALKFDPKTHLAMQGNDAIPIQFFQIWNGERVLFYPGSYSTGEFQVPPWMK